MLADRTPAVAARRGLPVPVPAHGRTAPADGRTAPARADQFLGNGSARSRKPSGELPFLAGSNR